MRTRLWFAFILVAGGLFGAVGQATAQEKGLLYAHRGGAFEFEENTMEGFRGSYEKGLRGFETDVRMTKDGELVILHDDKLDRTHNATGSVEHKTAAELRTITTKKKGQGFLFLDELLSFLADKPGIYLELEMKTGNKELYPDARLEEYCRKLHETVVARQPKGSFYIFTSFDERPLKIVKGLDANADLLLITGGPCSPEFIKQAQKLGVKRIGCRMEGTSRAAVREAQNAGLLVNGWPGHTLQDYQLAVGLGVDAICCDIPVAIQTWKAKNEQIQLVCLNDDIPINVFS
ncbi:glycerophosphoryl diester phosphodiesterase [Singulisphaera sp. GP187]|uniref:glycerophosphodiester phosphodiesterase n=1 Tax=Singulisphaera sp. GP187 TaxID=1882752 RepID=UPI00092B6284|nr:glycerophosphodiester phosphodiesterase family protein [Singulisphaera sp. GP187]SIO22131.1 glycerophosphoryl diester phosphodiesterase [Singulisphaera sp. GP187]